MGATRVLMWAGLLSAIAAGTGCSKHAASDQPASIVGAGATFPYPLYAKWGEAWHGETGAKLNYQSIGSGGGLQQIKAGTVDFGASDAPLESKELDAAGLMQFPLVMGGVVPVVHLQGVPQGALVLDGEVLAGMYLGEIKKWDDVRLQALNPGLSLPSKDVTVVHRADGSGTTWIFTSYLSKVSADWTARVGADKSVRWPVGVGGKGNEGVSVYVQRVDGAIGYVEYAYAIQNKLHAAKLRNAAGNVVEPGLESFRAAAESADWKAAPAFRVVLTHQPGAKAWPITGASFILLHKDQRDAGKALAMLQFFDYGLRHGGASAAALHYVPMPENVVQLIEQAWREQVRVGGQPVWKSK